MAKYQVRNDVSGKVIFSEIQRKDPKTGKVGPLVAVRNEVIELSEDEYRKLFETEGTAYHKSLLKLVGKEGPAKAPAPPPPPAKTEKAIPENGKGAM